MPYRYGNWMFVPGFGWMWQPGGFNTWVNVPHVAGTTPVHFHALVAPAAGTVKTVVVGKGGPVSTLASSRLVVNAGSAGMGIPRGSLGNLSHVNRQVAKTGFAEVRPAPQFSTSSARTQGFGAPSHGMSAPSPSVHSAPAPHASGGTHH
jgi:hypothetical protein